MPTDHDARRRRTAEIAIDLIARDGLGAATIRAIAAAGQFSTAAITHYFADKHALLVWTYRQLTRIGEEQFSAASQSHPDDPLPALMTMVAWCPVNRRRWKTYLAFWDQASRDGDLATQLRGSTDTGLDLICGLIARHAALDAEPALLAARLLNSVIQGISLQAILAPEQWDERSVRDALSRAWTMSIEEPGKDLSSSDD